MAGDAVNIKVCSPLKLRSGLTGNYHAICHYSHNLPLPAIKNKPKIKWMKKGGPRFYRTRCARALRVRAQGLRIRENSASNFQGPICILAIYAEIVEMSGSTREKRSLYQISMMVGLGYGDDLLRRQMLITF
jgi:hypothetical protein